MVKKRRQKNLLSLNFPQNEVEKILQEQIEKGKKLLKIPIENLSQWKLAEDKYNNWHSQNFEQLGKIFKYKNIGLDYTKATWYLGNIFLSNLILSEKIHKLHYDIKDKIKKLKSILSSLQLLAEVESDKSELQKVFFIHGTDCGTSDRVLEFLTKKGIKPVILKELAAAGKTIIEMIQLRSDVKYAIALLTPDNLGGISKQKLNHRSEQNVLLELGIFVGKLGRENVSSLYEESVELPLDYHDFKHIKIDKTRKWQKPLIAELKAAGFELNK